MRCATWEMPFTPTKETFIYYVIWERYYVFISAARKKYTRPRKRVYEEGAALGILSRTLFDTRIANFIKNSLTENKQIGTGTGRVYVDVTWSMQKNGAKKSYPCIMSNCTIYIYHTCAVKWRARKTLIFCHDCCNLDIPENVFSGSLIFTVVTERIIYFTILIG
jgi:hypothetical protein